MVDEEWADWECPVCGATQSDPESITVTSCHNGHACILGPIDEKQSQRWAEEYEFERIRSFREL